MECRSGRFLRYVCVFLLACAKLAGLAIAFFVVRYYYGLATAVLVTTGLATIVVHVLVVLTWGWVQRVEGDGRGTPPSLNAYRNLARVKLAVVFGLLVASLALRLVWLSVVFGVWAAVWLIALRIWRGVMPVQEEVSGNSI